MSNIMMQRVRPDWKALLRGAEIAAAFDGGVSFGFGTVCTFAHTIAPYSDDVQGIGVPNEQRRRT